MAMPQADWRSAVPVDTAPGTVTAPVPVITSGTEAIRAARDFASSIAAVDPAIAQVAQSHFLFVDVLAVLGPPPVRQRLFADVLAGARLANGMAERGGPHAQDLKTKLIRAHGSHDPVARKYHHVGNYLINDVLPPNHGQI
jgi:hypothetical protein